MTTKSSSALPVLVVGGGIGRVAAALALARQAALQEMQEQAQKLGANAVVGVDLDFEVLGQGNGMLMVSASGTAVVLGNDERGH